MSEQKESSSVLFNLQELMSLEDERVEAEAAEKRQAEEDARLAKEEAERQRIAAAEAARQAEEDAKLAAERAEREEEERVVREREEAALRVRLEEEARARAAEQERLLEHERQMQSIKAKQRKGIHPLVFTGVIALGLAILAGAGSWGYNAYQESIRGRELADERRAQAEQAKQEAAAALAERAEQERLARERNAELEARLAEEKRRAEEEQVAARNSKVRGPRPRPQGGTRMTASMTSMGGGFDPLAGLEGL